MENRIKKIILFHNDCEGCQYFDDKKDCPRHSMKVELMKQLKYESLLNGNSFEVMRSKERYQIVNEKKKVNKHGKTIADKLSIGKVDAIVDTHRKELKMNTNILNAYILTIYKDNSMRITIFDDITVDGNNFKCLGEN